MPVIPLGSDDWVQNPDGTWGPPHAGVIPGTTLNMPGAYQPGAAPPYSGGPQGLMPGGGVMGRQGATPGAPSMGYPQFGGLPPIVAAQLGTVGGDDPLGSSLTFGGPSAPPPMPAHPLAPTPGYRYGAVTLKDSLPGSMPARPATGMATPPAGPLASASGGIGSDANIPLAPAAADPLANAPLPPPRPKGKVDPKKVNLGYGAPFTTVPRPNADPIHPLLGGAPDATALDLAALFRRRQA